jgi:hypothetical protein
VSDSPTAFGFAAFPRQGGHLVTLPDNVLNRLKAKRGPGESYSDVIIRLASG